jgi:tetratricopeptide (TPR) repeat protein
LIEGDTDGRMLNRLKSLQSQGRLEAAELSFARILSETPNHLHAWLGLGYCASLTGEPARALRAFERAVAIGPEDDAAALACSDALCHAGQLDAARRVLVARPQSLRQQMALGDMAQRLGRYAEAVGHFTAAQSCEPSADQPVRRLFELHRRHGAWTEAHAMADRLAALSPLNAGTGWYMRALLHAALGDRKAAIAALREGLLCDPESDPILSELARVLRQSGRTAEARTLLAGSPPRYGVLLARAELDIACRQHDAAIRHLTTAHLLEPNRPEPLLRIAAVEAECGNQTIAQAAAKRIEACCGAGHRLTSLRSRLASFRTAGDETAALGIALEMAALQPGDAGIAAELARQYRLTGDPAAARRVIRDALAQNPIDLGTLTEAGEQASAADDRAAALAFYQRVLVLSPEHLSHHLRVARLLHDLDRLDEAEAVLHAAEARFGRAPDILLERTRLLREAGALQQALEMARQAQAEHPAHFALWFDRFHLELRLSAVSAVQACLDLAMPQTALEAGQVLCARARLAQRMGEPDQAAAHFTASLVLYPQHPTALNELFDLHLRALDLDGAAAVQARHAALEAGNRLMRGSTANASQSHLGQLLNDFLIDRAAIRELAAVRPLRPEEQVPRFLALIRRRPDHIPAALALLVALRDGGRFGRPRASNGADGIRPVMPRRITQFWDAEAPPGDMRAISRSWVEHNPGHRHVLFNDRTARSYLEQQFPPAVAAAYRRSRDPTAKADLLRLAVLYHWGGVWADMDDRCHAPVSDVVPAWARACFWQERSGFLCNNFMAAMPGHPILRRALTTAVTAINRGDRDKVWMLTGPGLLSRAFAVEMAQAGDGWSSWLDHIHVLDEFEVYPYLAFHCRTSHKRLGQHWTMTAFAPSQSPPKTVAPRASVAA